MSEPNLSPEAKNAIRKYVINLVIPSSLVLTIIAFILGFVAKDYGTTIAMSEAQLKYSDYIAQAFVNAKNAQIMADETKETVKEINSLVETTKELNKTANDAKSVANILRRDRAFINKLKTEFTKWTPVTESPRVGFDPNCEYKWQITNTVAGGYEVKGDVIYASHVNSQYLSTAFRSPSYNSNSGRWVKKDDVTSQIGRGETVKIQLYKRCSVLN